MSRQTLISIGVLILVFVSGIAVGLSLSGSASSPAAATKAPTSTSSGFFTDATAQQRVEENTVYASRIRELEAELAEKKNDQKDILADRLRFLKKYQKQFGLQAVRGLEITPEMVEILGLSKEEQAAIEQHLKETQKEMEKIVDDDTVLAKQTDNGVTYDIPADPQGKALKDKLSNLISGDIGSDRADVFMNGGGFDVYGPFSNFAENKREIEITWTQQNGAPLYTVKQTADNGSMSFSGTTLDPRYQKYLPTSSGQ